MFYNVVDEFSVSFLLEYSEIVLSIFCLNCLYISWFTEIIGFDLFLSIPKYDLITIQ